MWFFTSFLLITAVRAQNGSEYLENAIEILRKNTQTMDSQRKIDEEPKQEVPSGLNLAKNELADYYESAVKNGNTVKIGTTLGDANVAVYELNDDNRFNSESSQPNFEDPSGYHYYYYPLKDFESELNIKNHDKEPIKHKEAIKHKDRDHDHNIQIVEKPSMEETNKKKALEPLFMAISGFIGMSVMFVLSLLILPKLASGKPSKAVKEPKEGDTLAKVIYQAIEGYDCSERLSCEFGKTTRAFNVHNNRFFKLLRRIGPRILSKQLYNINKYSNKKHKCAQIQCKPPKSKERPVKGKS